MAFSKIELPHNMSGEVDWDTLGKMLCAHLLGEVLCASYVDRKYGIAEPGLVPDTDWTFLYHEDNVVALQKSFKDSPINAFMGRGVIDLPMDVIAQYLESHEHRKEWDRYLVEIKPVKMFSYTDSILYMHLAATNCLVKQERDFVHFERMTYVGDKYVRSAMAVDVPECPPKPGIIRAELQPGTGWVLEPYRGCTTQTLVSYLAHTDLKALPPMLINRAIRRQPKAIYRIRKILMSNAGRLRSLSLEPRDYSPWSEDSLTSIDRRQVMDATAEYYQEQEKKYAEDVTIDEYMGQARDYHKAHSTISINLNPHSNGNKANGKVALKNVTSEDQSHLPPKATKKRGSIRGSLKKALSSPKGKKKSSAATSDSNRHNIEYRRIQSAPDFGDPGAKFLVGNGLPKDAVAMHAFHGDMSAVAASGTGLLWQTAAPMDSNMVGSNHFLELSIDSDPHIQENTGLKVDNPEAFYTPQESDEDGKRSVDNNDNAESKFATPHESESGDDTSGGGLESNHTDLGHTGKANVTGIQMCGIDGGGMTKEEVGEGSSSINEVVGNGYIVHDGVHGITLENGGSRISDDTAMTSQSEMLSTPWQKKDSIRNCTDSDGAMRNGLNEADMEEVAEQPFGVCPSEFLQNLNIVKDEDLVQDEGKATMGNLTDSDDGYKDNDDLTQSLPSFRFSSKPSSSSPNQSVRKSSSEEHLAI